VAAVKRKLAIIFRYGASEHVDFLPSLPLVVQQLSEQGWEVHHYGFRGKGKVPESLKTHAQIHRGPFRVHRGRSLDKWWKAFLWLLYLPALGRTLQKQGIECVFVDETLPGSAGLLRRGYKRSLAFTVHDFFTEIYLAEGSLFAWLGRWLQAKDVKAWNSLDQIFTRVQVAKESLGKLGIEPDRIHVVPDAVDGTQFSPGLSSEERKQVRERWGIWTEDLVMVHHGIMHPNKGNVLLVEALFRLRHQLPNLKLLLIGDGPEKREVLNTAGRRGISDRVVCTGWVKTLDDIATLLRASDIGVVMRRGMPGDEYHVTSTLVHNLATGLPTIAVRLPGIEEVVQDGVQGGLFDPECGVEFDQWILRLARDPSVRHQFGSAGRELALTRFCPDTIASHYVNALSANFSGR